jgi:DNA-directed RNA polymerase subunit N (RpoN/RPB10)
MIIQAGRICKGDFLQKLRKFRRSFARIDELAMKTRRPRRRRAQKNSGQGVKNVVCCRTGKGAAIMADVFISYHEKSAGELAERIADALDAAGISSWCARRDLPPGSDFADEIPAQIDACRVFLLIMDETIYDSPHIKSELCIAFDRLKDNVTILPFPTGKVIRKGWLRYYLSHIQSVRIPLSDPQRVDKLVQLVARILGAPLRKPQQPEPPLSGVALT